MKVRTVDAIMGKGFLLRACWAGALAAAIGVPIANADIYTWVDASGRVTVSNLDPPKDVKVTNVVHVKDTPKPAPTEDATREALRQAEVQALADRVRQLQDEVDAARRQPPVQIDYNIVAAPPQMAYAGEWAPPEPAYAPPAPVASGCDPSWYGCAFGWPGVYGTSVVVVNGSRPHRFFPGKGGGRRFFGPPHVQPQPHPPWGPPLVASAPIGRRFH